MDHVVSIEELLESGAHFGHLTRRWNPKMVQYIFAERNGIHIIDLRKTQVLVDIARRAVHEIAIQGKVVLRFVVNSKGLVDKVEILRSVSPSIDKEAIRVVSTMSHWTPGEVKGKKVSVYFTLPISFKLDGNKTTNKKAP